MINPTKADKIISGILESPNESKTIEFKPSIPWPSKIDQIQNNDKAQEIIMGILGMSNIRDGGKIILGIEKNAPGGKYIRKGMKKIDLKTYDQDLIFDYIRNFGEPEPKFQILNVEGYRSVGNERNYRFSDRKRNRIIFDKNAKDLSNSLSCSSSKKHKRRD